MKNSQSELRLIAVVGLLLIPIVLLGWLFVNESNKSINFAKKELVGTAYLRNVLPVFAKLAKGQSPSPVELEAFSDARKAMDGVLGTELQSHDFDAAIQAFTTNPRLALKAGRTLIADVGDRSNLILDPDLDTFYLMDTAVVQVPELLDLSAQANSVAISSGGHGSYNSSILLLAGRFEATLLKARDSVGRAIGGNIDGSLRATMGASLTSFNHVGDVYLADLNSGATSKADLPAQELGQNFAQGTLEFWSSTTDQLNALLQKRISVLAKELYSAIAISSFFTWVAIAIATTLMQKLLHRMDDEILYLAHHDQMTRLKNRATFSTEMEQVLVKAAQSGELLALHLVDVDNFKTINDSFGHHAGDEVLKAIAARLLSNSRESDLVARLGGDEFVVLQRDAKNLSSVEDFANRLALAMREPIGVDGQAFKCSVSIGTAVSPLHGATVDDLMAKADLALYARKSAGRDGATMFDLQLLDDVTERMRLENEVRLAIAESRFTLHYQPQFNAFGKEIRGFEALLRLKGSDGENIPPGEFIPVAERLGVIDEIGAQVLSQACQTATHWPKHISISVNLSAVQFSTGSISKTIAEALASSGLAPSRLEVEITEGLLMQDTEAVLAELAAIRAMGVSIALDDFGVGYSSLSYLWRFPFDKIKIYRSFIKALEIADNNAQNILRTIVVLGQTLKMKVTAEGVETVSQAEFMRELKCDEIQGFLYGRPIPEIDLPSFILNASRAKNAIANSNKPLASGGATASMA